MKKIASLVYVMTKGAFTNMGTGSINRGKDKDKGKPIKKKLQSIGLGLLLLVALLPTLFSLTYSSRESTLFLMEQGMEGSYPGLIILVSTVLVMTLSVYTAASVYYFSTDTDILLAMPIKSWQILLSRFISIVVYQYLVMILLYLPSAAGYLWANFSVRALLGWLISGVFVPILPILIISIIIIFVINLVPFLHNKNRLTVFLNVILIVLVIGLSLSSQFFLDSTLMTDYLVKGSESLNALSYIIPITYGAELMIAGEGVLSFILGLLIVVGSSVLFILLALLFLQKFYFKSLLKFNSASASTKKKLRKTKGAESAFNSLVRREWLTALRTPSYMLNGVMGAFILPIMFIVIFVFGLLQSGEDLAGSSLIADVRNLVGVALAGEYLLQLSLGILIGLGMGIFMCGMNNLSVTAFSRDAKHLDALQSLPLKTGEVIFSKLVPGFVLGLLSSLMLIVPAIIILQLPTILSLALVVSTIIASYLVNLGNLLWDMIKPFLNWTDENMAMKGNVGMLVPMFASFLFMILAGLLIGLAPWSWHISAAIVLVATVLISSLFTWVALAKGDHLWRELMNK